MNLYSSGTDAVIDRKQIIQAYRNNRARTEAIFAMLTPDRYYESPIPLRHPPVFYEGHISAFAVNLFLKRGLGHSALDSDLELLFARGIDPSDQTAMAKSTVDVWPTRGEVRRYAHRADEAILGALATGIIEDDNNPVLRLGQCVFSMLEHEVMHQETLLYMWHRFDPRQKIRQNGCELMGVTSQPPTAPTLVTIPTGTAKLGAAVADIPFGWDNEFPLCPVEVPAFAIDVHNVTNADFLSFIEARGYDDQSLWTTAAWERRTRTGRSHPLFWERIGGEWVWRSMFERVRLPAAWPVYVTHDEASAYAKWRGLRLPTEAEYHRAAYGTPSGVERSYPWGEDEPDETRGNFDFRHLDPVPVGWYPGGTSAWGVHELVGNGWEWTSTVFQGFPGFEVMPSYPEYSADFFDGDHFVVKGASPVTGRDLIRRSFRNWFRPDYPYVYATFRCVRNKS